MQSFLNTIDLSKRIDRDVISILSSSILRSWPFCMASADAPFDTLPDRVL
jgi:hypothetical protein